METVQSIQISNYSTGQKEPGMAILARMNLCVVAAGNVREQPPLVLDMPYSLQNSTPQDDLLQSPIKE